ncbi:MAG: glycine cleavage system protein H [Bacteroidetes bacterium GWF2_43_63]|nr:MAG: glycine cleavage system protein H [Bacteroidetes bacterium GWE2_42_42]OFY56325.1 MAG: glycine cleavage system protein H [Bacteroidetes bacterium GWF2_43_63]HBG71912.1 glycine cleavage system protein GcvH [Bacteroidales bacterium]HCB61813.1 glycine cleavage system protein GcvH [Bacteroidales bacterium]HCY23835.1 glycine cleavage system protein GcvH [Bacteroidales bacterium]
MNIPENLLYTKSHEWVRVEGETAFIGVSDFAQSELGDVVFVEVETVGETLDREEALGTIEAVKTVTDVYMPVGGEVLEFNEKVKETPDLINKDPYGEGWIVKIKISDPAQLNDLMNAASYTAHTGH